MSNANKGMTETQMIEGLKLAKLDDTIDNRAAICMVTMRAVHESGMSVPESFDAVMGHGAYANMAGRLWETLRAVA